MDDVRARNTDSEKDVEHGAAEAGGKAHNGSECLYRMRLGNTTWKKPHTATVMLATRSASELPTAKMVRPIMASERPKMRPNVCIRISKNQRQSGEGYLKEIDNFICYCHDPDHRHHKSRRASYHPSDYAISLVRENQDENCHRNSRDQGSQQEPSSAP